MVRNLEVQKFENILESRKLGWTKTILMTQSHLRKAKNPSAQNLVLASGLVEKALAGAEGSCRIVLQ